MTRTSELRATLANPPVLAPLGCGSPGAASEGSTLAGSGPDDRPSMKPTEPDSRRDPGDRATREPGAGAARRPLASEIGRHGRLSP